MEHRPRLWLGNLPYVAQKADVEELFIKNSIDMYASDVRLCQAKDAENARRDMQGRDIRGRAVKLNYDTRKKPNQARRDSKCVFDRWKQSDEAPSHWITPQEEGRRLYVGGLPKLRHQFAVDTLMREIFKNYPLEAVSKIIWPHPSTSSKPGDHFYCFVDLPIANLAEDAARALNGVRGAHGGAYRISVASPSSCRKVLREQFGQFPSPEVAQNITLPPRNLDANWRRVDVSFNGGEVSI